VNGKVVDCTGVNAVYCDIHGDCSCEWTDDDFLEDAQCSIHGYFTDHPHTVSDHPVRRPDARGTDLLQLW